MYSGTHLAFAVDLAITTTSLGTTTTITGNLLSSWNSPFGLSWLSVTTASVRMEVSPGIGVTYLEASGTVQFQYSTVSLEPTFTLLAWGSLANITFRIDNIVFPSMRQLLTVLNPSMIIPQVLLTELHPSVLPSMGPSVGHAAALHDAGTPVSLPAFTLLLSTFTSVPLNATYGLSLLTTALINPSAASAQLASLLTARGLIVTGALYDE